FVSRIGSPLQSTWCRAYGTANWTYTKKMVELSSGNILLGGTDNSQIYLTMTDYNGYALWTRRMNLNTYENVIDLKETSTGNIMILFSDGDAMGESRYGVWNISPTGT